MYVKNDPAWVNGAAPGISAERLNHLETQYDEGKLDLDAALHGTTGHTHAGTAGTGPKIPDGSLASGVATTSTASTIAKRDASGNLTAKQLISDVASGTPPLQVTSPTVVSNLNADLLDGLHASALGGKRTAKGTIPDNSADPSVTLGWRPGLVILFSRRDGSPTYWYALIRLDALAECLVLSYTGSLSAVMETSTAEEYIEITSSGFKYWTDAGVASGLRDAIQYFAAE